VPVDCFFEWRTVKGARAKQAFTAAMKDHALFAIGGLWKNWRHPQSGEWIRTVAIITLPSNELVAQIHDRMPLILPKAACEGDARWGWPGVTPAAILTDPRLARRSDPG
jgi:putative SOS response-associated peptidase YedK